MNIIRRSWSFPKNTLAFWGVTLALLLFACGQEPAQPSAKPEPPPAAQTPPKVGPPSQAKTAPVPEKVLKVVKDRSGKHTARVMQRGDKQVVVRDGQAGPEYDEVGEVAFSADGRTLAYEAQKGEVRVLVLDEREWLLEAAVAHGSLKVSPDNRRLAMVARTKDRWQVMVDGKPDPPFDFVFTDTLRFSPDSKRLGYLALKGEMLHVVVDGQALYQLNIMIAGEKALKESLSKTKAAEPEKGREGKAK